MASVATLSTQKSSLTDPPANLKEAIDWVLRVTGKDGKALNDDDCICGLAAAVCDLMDGVDMSHLGDLEGGSHSNIANLISTVQGLHGTKTVRDLIEGLGDGLAKFIGWVEKSKTNVGGTSVVGSGVGKKYSLPEENAYKSAYINKNGTPYTWSELKGGTSDRAKCAKIFMGSIPLVFNGLAYLFWLCHGDVKRWRDMNIDGDDVPFLGSVMTCLGYDTKQLEKKSGKEVVEKCLTIFIDCKSSVSSSYGEFLKTIYEKGTSGSETINGGTNQNTSTNHHLTLLYILSAGYFRRVQMNLQETAATTKQSSSASKEPREPKTIREILYWLSALPYSPIYQELIRKVKEMIQGNSGENGSMTFIKDGNTRFSIDKESAVFYLMAGCIYAPLVILSLEGRFASDATGSVSSQGASDSIPIHDLYANQCFNFGFPSRATGAYSLLSDCVMALFYQLYFLKEHCIGMPWRSIGWGDCRFGYGTNYAEVKSWICGADTLLYGKSTHIDSRTIKDNRGKHKGKCGKQRASGGVPSPLQAFLCDCLQVFTCDDVYKTSMKLTSKSDVTGYPPIASHIDHRTQGQYCPVPMGYRKIYGTNNIDSDSWVGYRISAILYYYSNNDIKDSCLYHLVRCIIALTGNSPHVIGTLWGYYCGFGGVYGVISTPGGKKELEESFKKQTDEWCLVRPTDGVGTTDDIGKAATLWRGGTHNATTTGDKGEHTKGVLDSMVSCEEIPTTDTSCGRYLDTLGGSIYNTLSTKYSTVYLSWILYLTEVFHQGLEQLLSKFKNIDCSTAGCVGHSSTGSGRCGLSGECKEGNHGANLGNGGGTCTCVSIVCCAGVLPLFFRYGFTYEKPLELAGLATATGGQSANHNEKTLRKCHQFATQLARVVSSPYYTTLLKSINTFLYWLRLPFITVSTLAWILCLVYLLWAVLVPLDWLHFRSHWMLPGCHWLDGQGLWFKISKVVVIKDTDLDYSPLGSVDFFR